MQIERDEDEKTKAEPNQKPGKTDSPAEDLRWEHLAEKEIMLSGHDTVSRLLVIRVIKEEGKTIER
jgi:hypothetical protein